MGVHRHHRINRGIWRAWFESVKIVYVCVHGGGDMKAERDKGVGMGIGMGMSSSSSSSTIITRSSSSCWNVRVILSIILATTIAIAGLLGLHKPLINGCIMTFMYPTYIPVPVPINSTDNKYGLYLYHEGWKRIDFQLHLVKLSGVPVLFIPGNGGSYKQVRTIPACG